MAREKNGNGGILGEFTHLGMDGTVGKILGPHGVAYIRNAKSRITQLAECAGKRFSRMNLHYGYRFPHLRIRSASPALEDGGDVE